GPVYGDAFVRVLSSAVVGLNVHQQFGERGDPARYGTGANMRVFELAAVGTPQLSDAKAAIPRHFAPEREIVLYRSVEELKERAGARPPRHCARGGKIALYRGGGELRERARAPLADEPLRRGLATAARERAVR